MPTDDQDRLRAWGDDWQFFGRCRELQWLRAMRRVAAMRAALVSLGVTDPAVLGEPVPELAATGPGLPDWARVAGPPPSPGPDPRLTEAPRRNLFG